MFNIPKINVLNQSMFGDKFAQVKITESALLFGMPINMLNSANAVVRISMGEKSISGVRV